MTKTKFKKMLKEVSPRKLRYMHLSSEIYLTWEQYQYVQKLLLKNK